MKIGDKVLCLVDFSDKSGAGGFGVKTATLSGTVVYIHPQARFYVASVAMPLGRSFRTTEYFK
ncbi:MAG: hypothetical protein K5990_02035 [Oscillospiraceae bacterium]|nr:hypothetical protein [Oscillospiraceae bacterium]